MGIYKGSSIYKQGNGGGGGGSVITDDTLKGNGTAENPIGVDPQKLNFEGEGGTTSERKAPVKSTITNEQTNRAGFETNGSFFAGSYESTVSQTFASRRKIGNNGVAARFQVYSDGTAAFQQIKNVNGTDQERARLQFGEGSGGLNWGSMTIGGVTKHLKYENDSPVVASVDITTGTEYRKVFEDDWIEIGFLPHFDSEDRTYMAVRFKFETSVIFSFYLTKTLVPPGQGFLFPYVNAYENDILHVLPLVNHPFMNYNLAWHINNNVLNFYCTKL